MPEGYLQDNEAKNIKKCNDTNFKFYFDVERNKTICFKYDYDCPYGYSIFNSSNNECIQSLIFNTHLYNFKYSNYSYEDLLKIIIPELINNYNGASNVIIRKDNINFQITSEDNEIKTVKGLFTNKNNLSVIDLADCEQLLRSANNIDPNIPLIILKAEKSSNNIAEKDVQYEVYN